MGLNESAGYLSVGAIAFLTGWIASDYGLIPYPFYIGIILSVTGLLFSLFLVKDTVHHVAVESASSSGKGLDHVFWETTWKDPNLGSITQAGLVNNLNDGMVWGLLPLLLAGAGFSIAEIGIIAAVYPGVWGLGQLITGKLADLWPKKGLLVWGMLLQGLCLFLMIFADSFYEYILLCMGLGVGTALVYPTFLAAIADYSTPSQRAESIGVFRLWRDLGYAIGALLTGILADLFGIYFSIAAIALLTALSALIIRIRMQRTPESS
jgi:MFS family permease